MKIIFHNIIELPKAILAEFESLILKKSNNYQKQFEKFVLEIQYQHGLRFQIEETIEIDDVIYTLKFEPFFEPDWIVAEVIEHKKFKKN